MKRFALVLVTTLFAPTAALAQSAYDSAVTARQAGDPARAVVLLDQWLAANPSDSDALVQRGYAHLAQDNLREARRDFEAALALAPSYQDANEGLALVKQREEPASRGFLVAGGSLGFLDGGRSDWGEASLAVELPVSATLSAGVRSTWYRRLRQADVELDATLVARPGDGVWLRAGLGMTPNADFRPELALSAGIDLRVQDGPQATVLTVNGAYQRFPSQDIVTLAPQVTQYLGAGDRWVTLRGIAVIAGGGDPELGVLGRMDFALTDHRRLFVGASNGPDTDLGNVTRVTSVFAGAELPLGERVALLPSTAHEWRQGGGERTELRLEMKVRF